ncbi:DUF438 domain-containing protein [bacterium]|nr:DUF438 domain-containing protein [bacterium]
MISVNENKTITPDTKVLDLVEQYPFLTDTLAKISPKFKALGNPLMRNTIGKVATLKMAAVMGSVPLQGLMSALVTTIRRETGEELGATTSSGNLEKDEKREALKGIILSLHAGEDVETARQQFNDLFGDVDASEIAMMEQQLIAEGLPAESIKDLCDIHVGVFKDALDGAPASPDQKPGHPVHTFIVENAEIKARTQDLRDVLEKIGGTPKPNCGCGSWHQIVALVNEIAEVEKHYLRKEHQLFPLLEEKGFDGPSQVMWAIHDDVRGWFKEAQKHIASEDGPALGELLPTLLTAIEEMIYKEEAILFPTAIDMLEHEDWAKIHKGEEEIGFCFVERGSEWSPRIKINLPKEGEKKTALDSPAVQAVDAVRDKHAALLETSKNNNGSANEVEETGEIPLDVGRMFPQQISLMLKHLPVEISFVDENDTVRYYTGVEHKIFPRTPAAIGRKVQNCHPPKSLHLVQQILNDFKAGTREVAEFWIDDFMGKFIHISYVAVRDEQGVYRGTLETVQDITHIRTLEGQKRLLDEE